MEYTEEELIMMGEAAACAAEDREKIQKSMYGMEMDDGEAEIEDRIIADLYSVATLLSGLAHGEEVILVDHEGVTV